MPKRGSLAQMKNEKKSRKDKKKIQTKTRHILIRQWAGREEGKPAKRIKKS